MRCRRLDPSAIMAGPPRQFWSKEVVKTNVRHNKPSKRNTEAPSRWILTWKGSQVIRDGVWWKEGRSRQVRVAMRWVRCDAMRWPKCQVCSVQCARWCFGCLVRSKC